ncbi:SDR family oxidoreductase [Pseudohaliea sp.]|uniref:SDR family NAD(P)-dependent oxidoreductase n=1 Tax=Pseudohaliea sp. TaxID=2740289 RepID=UPI0032ED6E79
MIVVTGATRGLGQAIAERFAGNGHRVVALARTAGGAGLESVQCDVSDYQSVKRAARLIKQMPEAVDAVINAAGIASMNLALTTSEGAVQRIVQTNLVGTIYCCQMFAPLLIRERRGLIVNFSTIAVALALKGESVYAASKAGVESFSRVFAREVADFNIRVNCIAPGPIRTDMLRGISDEQIEAIVAQQVISRAFEKADVCDLVELLMDEKSASISGQILRVGGA